MVASAVQAALVEAGYPAIAPDFVAPPSPPSEDQPSPAWQESSTKPRPLFKAVWVGTAGISSPAVAKAYHAELSQALAPLGLDDPASLWISNDAVLLASPMLCEADKATRSSVCLIAGTGSAGFAFEREEDGKLSSTDIKSDGVPGLRTVAQTGGWGYILGDKGSAWKIGLSAIQLVLDLDERRQNAMLACQPASTLSAFEQSICSALNVETPAELIAATYQDRVATTFFAAEDARKRWMAEATRVVFHFAFESAGTDPESHELAMRLVKRAIKHCIAALENLTLVCPPRQSTLTLGGGLWSRAEFVELLLTMWSEQGLRDAFRSVHIVQSPAAEAVAYLSQKCLAESA